MRDRATQLFCRHGLRRHRLHDVGACHEHVGRVLHHEDEVGHGRAVDGTTRARPHDHGKLRHDAGGQHIALKHIRVACQAVDAFLDTRTTGVTHADHGRTDLQRLVHDLADLARMHLRQRATEDREILRIDEDQPTVHRAIAGDDAVTGDPVLAHAEVGAAMFDEHVPFLERAFVEQQLDPFPRGKLATRMLGLYPAFAATRARLGPLLLQHLNDVLHRMLPACCPVSRI